MTLDPFSPHFIIEGIRRGLDWPCRQIAGALNARPLLRAIFYFSLGLCSAGVLFHFLTVSPEWGIWFVDNQGFALRFLQYGIGVISLSLMCGPLFVRTDHDEPARQRLMSLLFVTSILVILFHRSHLFERLSVTLLDSAVLVFVGLPLWLLSMARFRQSYSTRIALAFSIGGGLILATLQVTGLVKGAPWLLLPNRVLLVSLYFAAERVVLSNGPGSSAHWGLIRQFFLSPSHFLTVIPVRLQFLKSADDRLETRLKGLRDIFFGYAFILIWYESGLADRMVTMVSLAKTNPFSWVSFWGVGLLKYLQYYFLSNASISIPVGLMRWFGWSLPNAYEVPLLAVSPADRWRRWNTYYFEWFYVMVFVPVLKKTRQVWLAVFLVFFATFLVHTGSHYFYFLAGKQSDPFLWTDNYAAFFFLHAAAVYLSLRVGFIFGSGTSMSSWRGVIMTWILMCAVHYFAPH